MDTDDGTVFKGWMTQQEAECVCPHCKGEVKDRLTRPGDIWEDEWAYMDVVCGVCGREWTIAYKTMNIPVVVELKDEEDCETGEIYIVRG
jgi:hypothetical protein